MRSALLAGTTSLAAALGCVGNIGSGSPGGPTISEEAAQEVAVSGMRRLSVAEYRQTVTDLCGIEPAAAAEVLPSDTLSPFDNDYTLQTPSEPLIKGAELLAGDVAEAVIASPELRAKLVGCEPTSAGDAKCFASFVTELGRRALRRPLTSAEVQRFGGLLAFAEEAGDFWIAVGGALRAFLQHPEFLYRVEIGTPVAGMPGVYRLGAFEIAARLSYFLSLIHI